MTPPLDRHIKECRRSIARDDPTLLLATLSSLPANAWGTMESLLAYVVEKKAITCLQSVLDSQLDLRGFDLSAMAAADTGMLRLVLKSGVMATDNALRVAAAGGNVETVKELLTRGCILHDNLLGVGEACAANPNLLAELITMHEVASATLRAPGPMSDVSRAMASFWRQGLLGGGPLSNRPKRSDEILIKNAMPSFVRMVDASKIAVLPKKHQPDAIRELLESSQDDGDLAVELLVRRFVTKVDSDDRAKFIRGLFELGLRPGYRDSYGRNLLSIALISKDVQAGILFSAVPKANACSGGRTSFHYALRLGGSGAGQMDATTASFIADQLRARPHLDEVDIQIALRLAQRLVGIATFPIDATDKFGRSLLSHAMRPGENFSALLEAGANPDLPDHFGRTPLHYAAAAQNEAACKSLLEVGAKIVRDVKGKLPSEISPFGSSVDLMVRAERRHAIEQALVDAPVTTLQERRVQNDVL